MTAKPTEMAIHTNVTLRLLGKDLEPEEVSTAMGMAADRSHKKGDPVRARKSAVRDTGYWSATSSTHMAGTEDINKHIAWLVALVTPRRPLLLSYQQRGWTVDVWIGVHTNAGHGGPVVHPDALVALGNIGLAVCLDLYPDA